MAQWGLVDEIGKTAYEMIFCGRVAAINCLSSIFFGW